MPTRKVVLTVVLGLCVLTGLLSPAEAVITIRSAGVVNGIAVVEGRAASNTTISWEGAALTQANRKGNFAFQGVVPADCVGSLHEGDPAAAIDVALANCVPRAAAPVPQTGQTTSVAAGDDGSIRAGVPWPSPRFTDNGDGTVRDNLTGLIWLKNAHCVVGQPWLAALNIANTLASGSCGLTDGSVTGDWRLPNVRELQSLIDFSHPIHPAIPAGSPFINVLAIRYWSSTTPPPPNDIYAWTVDFSMGGTALVDKPPSGDQTFAGPHVWPVRGPQ
jgi:hypothetical protein